MIFLILVAIAIVIGLSVYALRLTSQVKKQREKVEASRLQKLQAQQKKHDYIVDSCTVIAKHIVAGELNISEGAIRLKVLLDNLELSEIDKQRFIAFEKLFVAVQDLDTHQARAALTADERRAQDKIRHKAEYKNSEPVVQAAKALLEFDFARYRPQN